MKSAGIWTQLFYFSSSATIHYITCTSAQATRTTVTMQAVSNTLSYHGFWSCRSQSNASKKKNRMQRHTWSVLRSIYVSQIYMRIILWFDMMKTSYLFSVHMNKCERTTKNSNQMTPFQMWSTEEVI